MPNTLFQGIFDQNATAIRIPQFLLCIAGSLIIGIFFAIIYSKNRWSKSFIVTLALLPAVVSVVIMMVNGNVGAGVAVAGAFSLVRFRSVPGSAMEIGTLFLAMAAGDDSLNAAGDGTSSTSADTSDSRVPSDKPSGEDSPMQRGQKGGGGQANSSNLIQINGGTLCVDAGGDGIDSNGSITVTGGEIYVYGPTNSGNGALDYAGTATISGGTVVAVGASGMSQNFSTDSTQGSMLVSVGSTLPEGDLTLTDSDGNVLVSCTPTKAYNSVVISCPELAEYETYTLTTGTSTTEIEMTSLIYDSDNMGRGGGSGDRSMPHDRQDMNSSPDSGTFPNLDNMPDSTDDSVI